MIPVQNCFPFILSIKKFNTKTPYGSRMCTVNWFYDRWMEYDETWQNLMPSAKYFWRSDSMSWHLIGWDILVHLTDGSSALLWLCVVSISPYVRFTFFDFSETLNGIWGNFTGSKKSLSNTNVCVFRANNKKKLWLSRPLIGWNIFDFSSAADFVAISSRHHRFRYTHRNILIKLLSILKTIYCYDIYIYCW